MATLLAIIESIDIAFGAADQFGRRVAVASQDGRELHRHRFDPSDAGKRRDFAAAVLDKFPPPSRIVSPDGAENWDPHVGMPEVDEVGLLAERVLTALLQAEAAESRAESAGGMSPIRKQATDLLDRPLPHSLNAERAVLSCCLHDPLRMDEVSLIVRGKDFFSPQYRAVFEHMLALHESGKTIDESLLRESLKQSDELTINGGDALLVELAEAGCKAIAVNAKVYAATVAGLAQQRELIYAATENLRDAVTANEADGLAARLDERLRAVTDGRHAEVKRLGQSLVDAMDGINDRVANGRPVGVSYPIDPLTRMTGGMKPGELVIVAARPGGGKTSLALNVAEHAAKQSIGVLIVSLEMSDRELCERLLSARSGVNGERIRDGRLSHEERRDLIEAEAGLHERPIFIDDAHGLTVRDIAAQARRLNRRGEIGLVIIDYLSLVEAENQRDPRHEQVAKNARRLKLLAKELKLPLLVLAQLNRETEKGNDHRPKLAHLRESGAIEQDADTVIFIHRPEMYQAEDPDLRGKVELIVAKNRHGATGLIAGKWNGATTTFSVPTPEVEKWDFT